MQPPKHPPSDEVPPFHQSRRHQRSQHSYAPHPHPHDRHDAAAAQGIVDGPDRCEIDRGEEVADDGVREDGTAEYVKYEVAVIGKHVGVEVGVLFDSNQDHGQC